MNQRTLTKLVGAMLFLGAVYFFAVGDPSDTAPSEQKALFRDVDGERVAQISVEQGDKSIELKSANDEWTVPARAGYRASADKIRSLLVKVLNRAEVRVARRRREGAVTWAIESVVA